MNTRIKFAAAGVIVLAILMYVAYWYRTLKPVAGLTHDIKQSTDQRKALQHEVEETADDPSENGMRVKQINAPPVTLQEFTTPNFISAAPAHQEPWLLSELKSIDLLFSAPLAAGSKIIVLTGNKAVASGGETSTDLKTLSLEVNAGVFAVKNLSTGVYEVYYDACFEGDACYKGQYAFIGIQ